MWKSTVYYWVFEITSREVKSTILITHKILYNSRANNRYQLIVLYKRSTP